MLDCEDGWKFLKITGHCYKVFKSGKKWEDANNVCKEQGLDGSLAVVHNKQTQDFIDSFDNASGLWIGARKVDGNWEWADGSTWNQKYTNWENNSPNNSTTEGVIRTYYNKWLDRNDTWSWFMCQYKL